MSVVRRLWIAATGLVLFAAPGCGPQDPGASGPAPIVTAAAPQTSEEAEVEVQAGEAKELAKQRVERRVTRRREY